MRLKPADRAIARRIARAVQPTAAAPIPSYPSPFQKLPEVQSDLKPALKHLGEVARVAQAAAQALDHGLRVRDEGRRQWSPSTLKNGHELLRYAPMHLRRSGFPELAAEVEKVVERIVADDERILAQGGGK